MLKKESPPILDTPQGGKEKIEEEIFTQEVSPVLGTAQPFPKVGLWHERPARMFQHRIGMLKTLSELHQEQSLKLDKSIQQKWTRLKDMRSPSEIKVLEQRVTRAWVKQNKPGRGYDEDEWRVRLEEKRMTRSPRGFSQVRFISDQLGNSTLQCAKSTEQNANNISSPLTANIISSEEQPPSIRCTSIELPV